jgi:hypothetical protein
MPKGAVGVHQACEVGARGDVRRAELPVDVMKLVLDLISRRVFLTSVEGKSRAWTVW